MSLTFEELRQANETRCNICFNHTLDGWNGAEWGNAMAGEFGEAAKELLSFFEQTWVSLKFMSTIKTCDTLKKMIRQLESDKDPDKLKKRLKKELADVVIYADLTAARFDIDLGEAVRDKFNEVSDKRNSGVRL